MYYIKPLNSISQSIFTELGKERYTVGEEIETPDALLVRSADCHGLEFNANLLAIARAGAGVNNIPLESCTQQGIVVFNTPGANANAVKEMVIGSMLAASRKLIPAAEWVQGLAGKGDDVPGLVEKGKKNFAGREIRGKKMGVIGLGAIGVAVANDCHALGMSVFGYDPFISIEHAWGLSRSILRAPSLEKLVENCDYISIHVPLMEETRNYINERLCKLFKPGAVLLNFARSELVDHAAVKAALANGGLAQYIVDFPTDDMLGVEGVLCIPHLGASTPESEDNCAAMAARELREYLEMGNITNSVNMPSCELPQSGEFRVCIINENKANMLGQITAVLAQKNVNIANMVNKSRGNIAYTIIDLDEGMDPAALSKLAALDGIVRVRFICHKS